MRGLFRAGGIALTQLAKQPLRQAYQGAMHQRWANMESTTLLMRCLPVPCMGVISLMNLRDLLEKSLEEGELPLTPLCTLLARTTPCSLIIINVDMSILSLGPVLSGSQ